MQASCPRPPAADMLRGTHRPRWYGICADHLANINREVREGRVWWRGDRKEAGGP
jgi:hypothetical protein